MRGGSLRPEGTFDFLPSDSESSRSLTMFAALHSCPETHAEGILAAPHWWRNDHQTMVPHHLGLRGILVGPGKTVIMGIQLHNMVHSLRLGVVHSYRPVFRRPSPRWTYSRDKVLGMDTLAMSHEHTRQATGHATSGTDLGFVYNPGT